MWDSGEGNGVPGDDKGDAGNAGGDEKPRETNMDEVAHACEVFDDDGTMDGWIRSGYASGGRHSIPFTEYSEK